MRPAIMADAFMISAMHHRLAAEIVTTDVLGEFINAYHLRMHHQARLHRRI